MPFAFRDHGLRVGGVADEHQHANVVSGAVAGLAVGAGLGQFGRPRGLAVDREGLVYVRDAAFCNVQVFLPDGTLLLAIGGRAEADGPGRYLLPAKVAADETGRIYVVDQYLHKVEVVRKLPVPAGPPAPG